MDFLDLRINRIQSHHQHGVLLPCNLGSFFRSPRPGEGTRFQPFIEEEKPSSLPEEAFDPVAALAAEQEQHILLERIEIELRPDKLGKTIDSLAEIRVANSDEDPLYPGGFSKHDSPHRGSCQEARQILYWKRRWLQHQSGLLHLHEIRTGQLLADRCHFD